MTAVRPRILLVDDEEGIRRGLARALGRRFEVVTAGGGAEALEHIQATSPFAAVIADLQMPGMDGVALLREVALVAPRTVRILFTGTLDGARVADSIAEVGVARVLYKPAATSDLVAALDDAVAQYERGQ